MGDPPSFTPALEDPALEGFVCQLPKAELHLHLVGAMRWSSVRELHPDGAALPPAPPWFAGDGRFTDFGAFQDAFRRFLRPCSGTAVAVERHAREVIADLAAQGVRYAELTITPRFHVRDDLPLQAVLEALARGRSLAMAEAPIAVRYLYGINRHDPLELVRRELDLTLEWSAGQADSPVVGIDLQGDETTGSAADFLPLYDAARSAGLRLRAHAGELCGPESVRAAVDELGADHIAHGVRAVEDPDLIEALAARGIWLHVCPTSNVKLGLFRSFAEHPLPVLRAAGCRVTVNSDDPVLFGATLLDEYRELARSFGLGREEIAALARAGFEASLLDAAARRPLMDEIDALAGRPTRS